MRRLALLPRVMLPILFVTISAGCSPLFQRHIEYQQVKPEAFPIIRAVGYAPIALQQGNTVEQKRLQAMKASKLEAYRELTERVYGQTIDANQQLSSLVLTNDQLSASVNGVIKGARVIKTYAVDDTYVTELELDFKQVYDIYQNVQPRPTIKSVRYYY